MPILEQRLEQRLVYRLHHPIENPDLTEEAEGTKGDISKVLSAKLSQHDMMLNTEAFLLSQWVARDEWTRYLDSPLIAHADAALKLKQEYDAVLGIRQAGIPYAQIFEMLGFPIFYIDYSHHKRNMKKPEMDEGQLTELRGKKSVLLTDIDIVTGRTIRETTNYLREEGVNVKGAYIGLFRWPRIKSEKSKCIGEDKTDFDKFWETNTMSRVASGIGYLCREYNDLLPKHFVLYTSNPSLKKRGSYAAKRIAEYFIGQTPGRQQ
jgi:hypoxanthine phosphoribosyltransferase